MDRNGFLIVVILMFLIVPDSFHASFARNFQNTIHEDAKDNSTATQVTPLPSPVSAGKESNPSPIDDASKSGKEKPNDPQLTDNSSNANPKGSNNTKNMASASLSTDKDKSHKTKEKDDNTTNLQLGTNGSCEVRNKTCGYVTMRACIQTSGNGSKELVLLVQNEGERNLKVHITISTSVEPLPDFEISNHQPKMVNILLTVAKSTTILLDAGNGDCVLHMDPSESEGNLFRYLSFYSKQVTPIYGAYFLFIVVVTFGGIWACCKLRKRKLQSGVPYQELEMAMPESAVAVNVDTAEGWDQHWDDDWDEDKAVKSPGGCHVGSISANGLTSRSSKKDGWEIDWED